MDSPWKVALMRHIRALVCMGLVAAVRLAAQGPGAPATGPPEPYVDRGVCPFECCTYRDWTALAPITAYTEPRAGSPMAFRIARGEQVRALTGDVHFARVGMVVVRRPVVVHTETGDSVSLGAADTAYVLSPLGEGVYHIWVRGRVVDAMFFWDDRNTYPRPKGETAVLVREPVKVWWVKVRAAGGPEGWIRMDRARVEGADACG
jgi:hypothetical protein